MTQEEKELLLMCLCARLPHKQKVCYKINDNSDEITETLSGCLLDYFKTGKIAVVKPYLRSMSSMNEEEREELSDYLCERVMSDKSGITFPPDPIHGKGIPFEWMSFCIDWLNKHHFDYRGLIPKGLALETPEGMYQN